MKPHQRLSAVVGLAAMGFGIALLVAPSLLTVGPIDRLQAALVAAGPERVLLFAGGVVVCYLAVALRGASGQPEKTPESSRFDRVADSPPETVTVGRQRILAAGLDAEIESAIDDGGRPLRRVRRRLRRSAVAVYADSYGTTEQAARRAVERGEWCRDRIPNLFLAGEDGPSPALGEQFRLLLVPKRERRRRIGRTVTAIERVENG